jgi:adenosylhomocysteine nucleosidase
LRRLAGGLRKPRDNDPLDDLASVTKQPTSPDQTGARVVVLVSADAEWRAVRAIYPRAPYQTSPFGEWFLEGVGLDDGSSLALVFFQGGWGKIAAAASTQYVIDRWHPELVINLGTCGGFAGEIALGAIILVETAVAYDIFEQMGDPVAHKAHYTTHLDLSWLGETYPKPVVRTTIASGDRDLVPAEIPGLKSRFAAQAGDWESAAIAWVAGRNGQRCLILRGVSDLVDEQGSPAYGDDDYFERAAQRLMQLLVGMLPGWISLAMRS